MYRQSIIPRKLLISSDEVVAASATENNVDVRQIIAAIQIAEERFIKPAICKDLYYDFRNKKNVIVTLVNKSFLEDAINEDNTGAAVVLNVGDIINAIELVDNTYYVDLWNEHLWKLCAECVMYIASPTNFSRFTAQGEMENNPKVISNEGQGSATVDLAKMKWKMDRMMMDRIDPLIAGMDEWLADNRASFPLSNCKSWYNIQNTDGISVKRKTAWIHNVYDRTNESECYPCNKDRM